MLDKTAFQNVPLRLKNGRKNSDKKWNTSVLVVLKSMGQVTEGLVNTTSSFCLVFNICANKFRLEGVKLLILDGLQNPS